VTDQSPVTCIGLWSTVKPATQDEPEQRYSLSQKLYSFLTLSTTAD